MKEHLKQIKIDMIIIALLCTALGIVLFVWPAETIDIICKVLAAGIIVIGMVEVVDYFVNRRLHPFSAILGTIVLLVGIWIFLKPDKLVSLIPIVIGVILLVHGIQDLQLALETKNNGYQKWWVMLIVAVISLILGVICVIHAFGVVKLTFKIIGIALIYDGITDLWVAIKAFWAQKMKEKEEKALEVEYREVDEEE